MATFVLIHGGGGSAWDWHLLVPELTSRGHDVVTPELPIEDRSAGFAEFGQTVVDAVGDRSDLVVVGHSYGAFTAPLIADKLPVRLLVLLTPMIPKPGEKPGDWWANTGYRSAEGLSAEEQFYNGVPAEVIAEAAAHSRDQVSAEGNEPWPLDSWPMCRRRCSSHARTSFSRRTSSAGWPPTDSASSRMKSMAVTACRSATRSNSPTASPRTRCAEDSRSGRSDGGAAHIGTAPPSTTGYCSQALCWV